ncbi:hypothetical protein K2173_025620 [Erythroxylum novogranatense]|uniref:Uncharacterized protein n=1 Tax=Erythroxylum novogranatense TaxID=1862640 RepID=A0AAV8SNV4_9ROSI|nr:hypothetical protein K2173_025620 [Erythroxylum novogranatense]
MPTHGAALALRGAENSTYDLPTSNLPPEFRLESSSRLQVPQLHHFHHHQDPRGSTNARVTLGHWHPNNQRATNQTSSTMRSQDPHFQELLSESIGSRGFYPSGGISYPSQHHDIPIQQVANWPSQVQSSAGATDLGSTNSRSQNSTVYDPMYETIGLPADPHLRVFVTRPNHGTL